MPRAVAGDQPLCDQCKEDSAFPGTEAPPQMDLAAPAQGYPPGVAWEPGMLLGSLAHLETAGCLGVAGDLVGDAHGIEETVLMRSRDLDARLRAGDRVRAGGAADPSFRLPVRGPRPLLRGEQPGEDIAARVVEPPDGVFCRLYGSFDSDARTWAE